MISLPWTMARLRRIALNVVAIGLASLSLGASSQEIKIVLSGNQEIPPVTTTGVGNRHRSPSTRTKTVTGNATIAGMAVTVAHIHEGAAGTNGPIIIPLVRTADNVWSVPPGARLTRFAIRELQGGQSLFQHPQRGSPQRRDPRPDQAVTGARRGPRAVIR